MTQAALPGTPNTVYDFDLNDFGNQLDFPKEKLDGMVIYVVGISEATFEGDFERPAKGLLFRFPSDPVIIDPWGVLLSVVLPPIRQTKQMIDRGRVPFVAKIIMKKSDRHRGQEYWTLERYTMQYDSNGNVVDPNVYPKTTEETGSSAKTKNAS